MFARDTAARRRGRSSSASLSCPPDPCTPLRRYTGRYVVRGGAGVRSAPPSHVRARNEGVLARVREAVRVRARSPALPRGALGAGRHTRQFSGYYGPITREQRSQKISYAQFNCVYF